MARKRQASTAAAVVRVFAERSLVLRQVCPPCAPMQSHALRIVPGNPCLAVVASFVSPVFPAKLKQTPPSDPMNEEHDWTPFDFVLHKFVNGTKVGAV